MALLAVIFSLGLTILIYSYIVSNPNNQYNFSKRDCWLICLIGSILLSIAIALFITEIRPNRIETKSKPQIDTLITYQSINQTIDTTYFYTFKK